MELDASEAEAAEVDIISHGKVPGLVHQPRLPITQLSPDEPGWVAGPVATAG